MIIMLLVAVIAVGLFVLGLSITWIRKGHPLESDVGSNRHMRERGIECAAAQLRRQEAERTGRGEYLIGCEAADCVGCGVSCGVGSGGEGSCK